VKLHEGGFVTLRTLRAGTALSLTLGAFLALPTLASAQTQDTGTTVAPGAGEGPEIEEVIVTAQRREQRLQDVPIAITVVDAEALDRFSVNSIEGVQTLVPTLTLRKGTTVANSAVVLRGIGTISFSLAAEPAVSTVVDGVVYARSGQAFNDLYDIQRIEVLRGPQGTLFGKNASAGALNIVTQGPGREFGGDVTVSAFSDQEYRVRANVSIPFTDTFGARLSATYGYYDGNIRNIFTGEDVNGTDRKGVRGVFEWRPNDRMDFRFIADYSETNDDCCAEVVGTAPNNAALLANLGSATPQGDATREVNQNLVSQTIGDTGGVSLQGNFDVGTTPSPPSSRSGTGPTASCATGTSCPRAPTTWACSSSTTTASRTSSSSRRSTGSPRPRASRSSTRWGCSSSTWTAATPSRGTTSPAPPRRGRRRDRDPAVQPGRLDLRLPVGHLEQQGGAG
jgi:iron complex outermembrane receptor protein